ncbi:hypothetical protein [Nocardioides jishulii]|uniref:Saccharopine dehydrogenase n=1 Tax=Nocardioides jishulii TaxID=2575440 RepID=A0A4U2YI78_9ACTN|nr:hypothetical protein [Nocardioides jishulii]QCX28131.1 hypothetical protein FCL41_11815 [Nocardioides jishulii]TKI60796.1 hypothetical protein FC770_14890 [Nocardioides jishulii]
MSPAEAPRVLVVGAGPWAEATLAALDERRTDGAGAVAVSSAVAVASDAFAAVLEERSPAVVVVTEADPGDQVLRACAERGVPVVDVHRSIASLDRARDLLEARPGARLVAADGWAGDVAAMAAVGLALPDDGGSREQEHVDIDVLLDAGDRAPDSWWDRFVGLHRSFAVYDRGQRRLVRGLGEPKPVPFTAGMRRARRIASPEQETLVEGGHAGSVALRVAFARRSTDLWLAVLVGSGAWRFLPASWRRAVLEPARAEPPAPHEIWVTRLAERSAVRVRVHDPLGRAHLVGASAATQVCRLLDPSREPVPEGVSAPEQAPDLSRDLDELRRRGVTFDVEVFSEAS